MRAAPVAARNARRTFPFLAFWLSGSPRLKALEALMKFRQATPGLPRLHRRPPKNTPSSPASTDCPQHTAIMATELTVQSERAFQKQPHVFQNNKKQGGKTKRAGKGGRRWVKDVGLGFRTPKNAIEGNYIGE